MRLLDKIHPSWHNLFIENYDQIRDLCAKINKFTVCPKREHIFNCFSIDVENIKLVMVGQDPYYNRYAATGYAFEVGNGTQPSLEIIKEMANRVDIEFSIDEIRGEVMLLNANLTTEVGRTKMHDWRDFTYKVLQYVNDNNRDCGFAFLGAYAKSICTPEIAEKSMFFCHPAYNAHSGCNHFNESFFEITSQYYDWIKSYAC